ncbi:ty3-gypsy retrotransposon protein [Tanacetum coccineum]
MTDTDKGSGEELAMRDDEAVESGDISILNSSTHNFVRPDVVERMCLPLEATKAFKVYIGSGETLLCENVCSRVTLHMQGLEVEVDLYVLPMQGPDVVLGKASMWIYECRGYALQARVPTCLPPPRSVDHRIHLLPNTKPVNVRPYRYPHYQKGKMEKLVNEMLSQGIIRFSQSPFSSPEHRFLVKRSKCVFGAGELEYLGHIISARGVQMDPKKIEAVREWPVPKNQRQVQGFLGLAGYYWCYSGGEVLSGFRRENGLLLHNNRYYLGQESKLKTLLLEEFHATPILRSWRNKEDIGWVVGFIFLERNAQVSGGIYQEVLGCGKTVHDGLHYGITASRGLTVIYLLSAKQRMEVKANRKRRDVEFNVGDMVLVKLQPYRQITLAKRLSNKLAKRYYRPYKVEARVGKVAYRLTLPASSKIHPIFHVSILKAFFVALRNGRPDEQILVQWIGESPEEATWEWLTEFRAAYPTYNLEDKVVFEEGGNDTSTGQDVVVQGVRTSKRDRVAPARFKDFVMG